MNKIDKVVKGNNYVKLRQFQYAYYHCYPSISAVWKQTPVHHLSPIYTHTLPAFLHPHPVSWYAPQVWVRICCCSGHKWLAGPDFVYCTICISTLLCGIWGIWQQNTANACFMIVQAWSNGQEYFPQQEITRGCKSSAKPASVNRKVMPKTCLMTSWPWPLT